MHEAHDRLGRLDELPRAGLVQGATPLEEMPNLAKAVGGARLFVKRDDCTGLAFGGNKVRQLDFYLGDALAKGADTLIVGGALQSNLVRTAAAAARKLGLDCHVVQMALVEKTDPAYLRSGNVLLNRLMGATLHAAPQGADNAAAERRMSGIAATLERQGRTPYVVPLTPGHAPFGALGYVDAAREILAQCRERGLELDEIVTPSGSAHTHGGLLFGLRALGSGMRVTGVCVRREAGAQRERVRQRCDEIAALLEVASPVGDRDIHVTDAYFWPGYGRMGEEVRRALLLAARSEALLLDPVYSAKTMAGFLERARRAEPGRVLAMLHTGGAPGIFAYEAELSAALDAAG